MAETAHVGPGTGSDATGGSQGGGGAQDKAQQVVGDAKEQVKEQAGQVKDQAQQQAQQVKEQAGGRLKSEVDRRSTEAGERVKSQAHDLRSVSEQLREQGKDGPAKVADQVAERVERVGGYLHESDGERILDDVEDFARRNPWAVVAGGVVAGHRGLALPQGVEHRALAAPRHERPAVRPPGAARPVGHRLRQRRRRRPRHDQRNGPRPDPAVHRRRRRLRRRRHDTGQLGATPTPAPTPVPSRRRGSSARTTRCAAEEASDGRAGGRPRDDPREKSIGELFKDLSEETSTLIRQEMALAKAELSEKGKEAGKGAGCSAAPASSASWPQAR